MQQQIKPYKFFLGLLLCMTLPVWGVHAAIGDVQLPWIPASPTSMDIRTLGPNDWNISTHEIIVTDNPIDFHPVQDYDFLVSQLQAEDKAITIDQIVEEIPQQIENQGTSGRFWTGRRTLIIGGTVILAAVLVGIFLALAGSGSGSGATSAAGGGASGGAGGPNDFDNLPGGGGEGAPGGDGGGGSGGPEGSNSLFPGGGGAGGDGEGDESYSGDEGNRSSIPSNPEPSTMLLVSLGLALPFIRKFLGGK